MGKDLGTYHARVELEDGQGWIAQWTTGARYERGDDTISPLDANVIPPAWDTQDELIHSILWQYLEGNYSCDCNKTIFLVRAEGKDPDFEVLECGDTMPIKNLTLICPDLSEIELIKNGTEKLNQEG